jgi:hypothetical protein
MMRATRGNEVVELQSRARRLRARQSWRVRSFPPIGGAASALFPQVVQHILLEATRTHKERLNWPEDLANHWHREVEKHFPEALVDEADCLEPLLVNDPKDRHVLATAIRAGASTIVTFNLRDFSPESLLPWNIHAVHPADYLITLHTISPDIVVAKLSDMARGRKMSTAAFLARLNRSVPDFASHVAQAVGWNIDEPNGDGS